MTGNGHKGPVPQRDLSDRTVISVSQYLSMGVVISFVLRTPCGTGPRNPVLMPVWETMGNQTLFTHAYMA